MTKRMNIALEDDAADLLLTLAGSPRKQGEYLSSLIRAAYAQPTAPADVTTATDPRRARLAALIAEAAPLARALLTADDPPNPDSTSINKAGSGVAL